MSACCVRGSRTRSFSTTRTGRRGSKHACAQLAHVVYHNRLGTQLERIERVERLTQAISRALGIDAATPARAARLCKADLSPAWWASFRSSRASWDATTRCMTAKRKPWRMRSNSITGRVFPETRCRESTEACVVALADKLESLAGLFGIGQAPSGDKDPFGLRRQALGVIRILAERKLPLALSTLIEDAFGVSSHRRGSRCTT